MTPFGVTKFRISLFTELCQCHADEKSKNKRCSRNAISFQRFQESSMCLTLRINCHPSIVAADPFDAGQFKSRPQGPHHLLTNRRLNRIGPNGRASPVTSATSPRSVPSDCGTFPGRKFAPCREKGNVAPECFRRHLILISRHGLQPGRPSIARQDRPARRAADL